MVRTWMPTVAGILSIISGGFGFLGSLILLLFFLVYYTASGIASPGYSVAPVGAVIITPVFILSIVAIVGGIFALKRKIWGVALAGAICSFLILLVWPLGVASIVLLAISKPEFDRVIHPSSSVPPSPVSPVS
jgi:hypothetical protein